MEMPSHCPQHPGEAHVTARGVGEFLDPPEIFKIQPLIITAAFWLQVISN